MHIQPILAALKRNKAGAILIGLQIALTLAIVCNALFIIRQKFDYQSRPTGIDESLLFTFENTWVGSKDEEVGPLAQADLETIRATPGVVDAYRSNSFPLRRGGWSTGLKLLPTDAKTKAHTALYLADEHTMATLGLHLIAGRNFTAADVGDYRALQVMGPPTTIVTKSVADKLFPDGNALGKTIYVSETTPTVIIGIVDTLQTPWVGGHWADTFTSNSILAPLRPLSQHSYFVVRTQPGQVNAAMKAVQARLNAANRLRVIDRARTFAEVREQAYRADSGMVILMAIVCGALLLVTAAGIVGLASFWVGQRQRQIGIRRALGATARDILHYFQLENALISGGAAVFGIATAVGLNLWLVTQFEMARLPLLYVLLASAVVVILGQLAVLQPALRASRVPPVIATRSV
jgi:putative ABC transport system permease protein